MIDSSFTRLVRCRAPIQLAGMGGLATPPLVSAVADAGGLGMLGGVMVPPAALAVMLDALRRSTTGRIGVNFLMPFVDMECITVAAEKADVVEFFYDTPRPDLVARVHDAGALACWQVGSPQEARIAMDSGCDLIVVQGIEAGGHVRGTMPLLVLLDQVLEFASIPVVAAGGVSTARGLAAVLAAGGGGIRVGTRFVTALESPAHPDYVKALIAAGADETELTSAFDDIWPGAPHRVLRACLDAARRHADETVGTVMVGGEERALPRFSIVPPDTSARGNVAAMCQYAGQSVEAISGRQSAADIVREITEGADRLLTSARG